MTAGSRAVAGTLLTLERGERHLLEVPRDRLPYWAALAVVGAGFVAYGLYDPIYGWGTFFLGLVAMSFVGGAVLSTRHHATDRRLVRTGYLGLKAVPLAGARVTRVKGLWGDTLTVENGAARLRVRFVTDGEAVERVLRQARGAA